MHPELASCGFSIPGVAIECLAKHVTFFDERIADGGGGRARQERLLHIVAGYRARFNDRQPLDELLELANMAGP